VKVRIFPGDQTGCGFYRCIEPGRVVAAGHADVEIDYVFHSDEEHGLEVTTQGKLGNERVVAVEDPGVDVIVLQRPAHRHVVEAIPYLQAHGVAVVCDYDDDFDALDPSNQAYLAYDPVRNPMNNKVWAKLGSQLADMVTVTTPALAKKYGAHGQVVVIPNYVPERYLDIKPEWHGPVFDSDAPRIGWAGNPHTHPGDLKVMGRAMHDLTWGGDAVFRTIGHTSTPGLVGAGDAEVLDWVGIDEFQHAVASFDIGVVPLKDSTFNKAKSYLKGLEYAALGVPFVASPTTPYRELAGYGAGDLVRTTTPNTRSWAEALQRLIEDEEYRARRAEEGRALAAEMTYEKNGEQWLRAWANALTLRRAR